MMILPREIVSDMTPSANRLSKSFLTIFTKKLLFYFGAFYFLHRLVPFLLFFSRTLHSKLLSNKYCSLDDGSDFILK